MSTVATTDLSDDHPDVVVAEVGLFHFGGLESFHAQAETIACFEDNTRVRGVLETPGNGRILVVDGGGSVRCALFGDELAQLAIDNGWVGVIVNGAVRDSATLAEMPVGVMALAAHPRRSNKWGDGRVSVPVDFLGVTVNPGDWIYADADGLAVAAGPVHL